MSYVPYIERYLRTSDLFYLVIVIFILLLKMNVFFEVIVDYTKFAQFKRANKQFDSCRHLTKLRKHFS